VKGLSIHTFAPVIDRYHLELVDNFWTPRLRRTGYLERAVRTRRRRRRHMPRHFYNASFSKASSAEPTGESRFGAFFPPREKCPRGLASVRTL
jgi:hypothetical protein